MISRITIDLTHEEHKALDNKAKKAGFKNCYDYIKWLAQQPETQYIDARGKK